MRHVIWLVLAGCAVARTPLAANHAANPGAPTGRLAGAPPSLRPGVIEYKDVPAMRTDAPPEPHHHHGG